MCISCNIIIFTKSINIIIIIFYKHHHQPVKVEGWLDWSDLMAPTAPDILTFLVVISTLHSVNYFCTTQVSHQCTEKKYFRKSTMRIFGEEGGSSLVHTMCWMVTMQSTDGCLTQGSGMKQSCQHSFGWSENNFSLNIFEKQTLSIL